MKRRKKNFFSQFSFRADFREEIVIVFVIDIVHQLKGSGVECNFDSSWGDADIQTYTQTF